MLATMIIGIFDFYLQILIQKCRTDEILLLISVIFIKARQMKKIDILQLAFQTSDDIKFASITK